MSIFFGLLLGLDAALLFVVFCLFVRDIVNHWRRK